MEEKVSDRNVAGLAVVLDPVSLHWSKTVPIRDFRGALVANSPDKGRAVAFECRTVATFYPEGPANGEPQRLELFHGRLIGGLKVCFRKTRRLGEIQPVVGPNRYGDRAARLLLDM